MDTFGHGSGFGGDQPAFLQHMPHQQCHLVARIGHGAQKPDCCPHEGECFRFTPVCVLDDILVRLAVTRELTRAI